MIKLDDNGDFVLVGGRMTTTTTPTQQNFISEVRCEQGQYEPQQDYGRNPFVWTISQSVSDRISDLNRIGQKYLVVQSIQYLNGSFIIQC